LTDREFQLWIDWLTRDGQLARDQVKPRQVYAADVASAKDRS
jgi:hypothetical protein